MPRTQVAASGVGIPSAAEVVVATLPGITYQSGNPVDLIAEVDVSPGTSTTGVTVNIRRGTTTAGPVVGTTGPSSPVAATRGVVTVSARDVQNVDVAGQQYVVTVTAVAQTVAGTVNNVTLRADY